MPATDASLFSLAVAVVLGGSLGCSATAPTSYDATDTSVIWTHGEGDGVPGIDDGALEFVKLTTGAAEAPSFVIWSDLTSGSSGSSSRPGFGPGPAVIWTGHHDARDGRRLDFELTMGDGKSGRVTIAGVDYDLSQGELLLVSTQAARPVVSQVRFDLKLFPEIEGEKLRASAKSTPQIREFFEGQRKVEAAESPK
jgi:hypothetical protein